MQTNLTNFFPQYLWFIISANPGCLVTFTTHQVNFTDLTTKWTSLNNFLKTHEIHRSSNEAWIMTQKCRRRCWMLIILRFLLTREAFTAEIHFKDVCGKETEHTDGLWLWIKHEGRDAKITFGWQHRFAMSQTAKAKITAQVKASQNPLGHLVWRGPPFGPQKQSTFSTAIKNTHVP